MRTRLAMGLLLGWCLLGGVGERLGAQEDVSPEAEKTMARPGKQIAFPATEQQLGYWLFLPAKYDADPSKKWPLLLFLHGAGERGDNLEVVKKHGPPKLVERNADFEFVVVSPQCPSETWWTAEQHVQKLLELVDRIQRDYRVDATRTYLTGLSMGGYGSWQLAAVAPRRFAAVAPICGGGETKWAESLAGVPIWAFHGAKDEVVPLSRSEEMVEAVRKAGGDVTLTVYPDAAHDSWTETYANPELYQWLLRHRAAAER